MVVEYGPVRVGLRPATLEVTHIADGWASGWARRYLFPRNVCMRERERERGEEEEGVSHEKQGHGACNDLAANKRAKSRFLTSKLDD